MQRFDVVDHTEFQTQIYNELARECNTYEVINRLSQSNTFVSLQSRANRNRAINDTSVILSYQPSLSIKYNIAML